MDTRGHIQAKTTAFILLEDVASAEVGDFRLCRLSRKIPGDAKVHCESISFCDVIKQNSEFDDSKSKMYE